MLQRSAGVVLLLCGVLAGCGSGDFTPPGAPATASPGSPTPSPSPEATSAGYLHVLQSPWVMTYGIDPTGRLHPPVTQRLSKDLHLLAGEPQGRFVYGAHGGLSVYGDGTVEREDGTIVTYTPDSRDGTLVEVSEQTPFPRTCANCPYDYGYWRWLKGGVNRVHGFFNYRWGSAGRHSVYAYASVAVAEDGYLGSVARQSYPPDGDPGEAMVDARSDVLYKDGSDPGRGGLEALLIEPDGTLTRMGWTNLCLATPVGYPTPLVAARGFLFAHAYNGVHTLCAYQGLRLKPLYALDLATSVAEAFIPSSEAEPVLLAMGVSGISGGRARPELRVLAMNGEGDLRPVYSEDLADYVKQLLFHPSGRFLYAVDAASRLRVYGVDGEGRLSLLMSIDHAGGSMAITLKEARHDAAPADR